MPASNQSKSGIKGASALRKAWFDDTALASALNASFDKIGFTEDYISAAAPPSSSSGKRKALKDAVWGMIEFDAAAMRIVDSPLLQRMRRIKQLGFSYLTYPSAEHSRFIHSVGMAHVVKRFVEAIDKEQGDAGVEFAQGVEGYATFSDLEPLQSADVIHAALLHDVGHLPFSHVAESAIVASPKYFKFGSLSYAEFQGKAEFHLGKAISLSEALSLLVVLSDRFSRFYKQRVVGRDDDDTILRIACLIAGQRVHDACPNIQHIISSSAVDADKIDYVTRDSNACGIPVGVDVSRVFLGSGVLKIEKASAPELGYGVNDRYIFALNASGWDTFDEIIRARSTLYQRVYLHPVTRTAESLFARALRLNASAELNGNPDLADVVSLWAECDVSMLNLLTKVADSEVRAVATALRDRRLPKKSCALSGEVARMHMPICEFLPELFSTNQRKFSARQNWTNVKASIKAAAETGLVRDRKDTIDAVAFEDAVRDETLKVADALKPSAPNLVPTAPLESIALIHIAALDSQKSNAPVFQNGELLTADDFTNARGVVDATEIFRSTGFVMATTGWAELVLIATRKILYTTGLASRPIPMTIQSGDEASSEDEDTDSESSPRSAAPSTSAISVHATAFMDNDAIARRAGVSRKRLHELYDVLEAGTYFDDTPILARREKPEDTATASQRYDRFDGEDGWRVTPASVAAFVDQFPPSLRDDLLKCLEKGTYLAQSTLASKLDAALTKILRTHPAGIVVVPLSTSSGGAAMATVQPKLNQKPIIFASDIESALAQSNEERPLVFVDDNAASGVQSSAQLFRYMQIPREDWPTTLRSEDGLFENTLNDQLLEKFKQVPFAIAVAAGHDAAKDRLEQTVARLDLKGFFGLHYGKSICSIQWPEPLQAYLTTVGRELVAGDRFGKTYGEVSTEEKVRCDKHAFGYQNFGGLTVAPFNVPTSTVTALWMPGRFQSRSWMPLFIRRGRRRHLILA